MRERVGERGGREGTQVTEEAAPELPSAGYQHLVERAGAVT